VQAETIQTQDPGALNLARAEARLPRWMFAVAIIAVLATGVTVGLPFALGLSLGAALSILNYFWLHQAIEALMHSGLSRVPHSVLAKVVIRYPAAILVLYLLYKSGWFSFTAILAGLFVPVAGILIEGVVQIVSGWRTA
jgi:hypothetical protein